MSKTIITALLWFSAIGCGIAAGLFFAFSTFIMTSLGRIDQSAGISAMNAINVDIVKSLFMPFFLGTTLTSALLALFAFFRLNESGAWMMLIGGIVYVAGMLVVTMVFNVPLNNALAAVDPATTEAASIWARYLSDWTFWNHVRTVSSIVASVLFIAAIAER